jgi:hypothetical protein
LPWDAIAAFEGAPIASQLPAPSTFTGASAAALTAFAKAIVEVRRDGHVAVSAAPGARESVVARAASAEALNLLNAASVAGTAFENAFKIAPIGSLNLERIEMTPVGVERGELLATIPLAPLEHTAVVHKEWSVTTKEFTSIVTDSLENYSETGVTENTELAQATTSQTAHANQFNVNGTVTGTYGPVTATVNSSFSSQDQDSQSANESRKHAIATTRKASARVKQEHKVTISATTVTGSSESSTRVLQNPSPTTPIRIDYFSLMRKWHVGLYRYGLRLTYDIAIPEPGSAMRKFYAELQELKGKLGPFRFVDASGQEVTHGQIATMSYDDLLKLADQVGASLPPPIKAAPPVRKNDNPPAGDGWHFVKLDFDLPQDTEIAKVHLYADLGTLKGKGLTIVVEGTTPTFRRDLGGGGIVDEDVPSFLVGATGPQTVYFNLIDVGPAYIEIEASLRPTADALARWRNDVWNALYNAAQTNYYAGQQDIANRVAALEDKIAGVDTLTLRREENEEVMKGVLRWLLGPNFHFMPDDVFAQFLMQSPLLNPNGNIDLLHGTVIDAARGDGLAVTAGGWYPMFQYQEMIKFVNEAIEWENVLYFLYSYFWDIPTSWDFVRQIRHSDPTRQAFLRAGSARVVLTVRPGWEQAWVAFVEAGIFGDTIDPRFTHPYLDIAAEMQAYAQTNYPGIPSANPGGGPLPDDGRYAATVSRAVLTPSVGPVTVAVASSDGFLVGYTAILDAYDPTTLDANGVRVSARQEAQTILAVPDATHITIERIDNAHDGSVKAFPVLQGGEKGQLIAEWFEYTPTSGTDIEVTSNLATIA